jgi:site-specific DNA-methyltransferase (adenine-specific)
VKKAIEKAGREGVEDWQGWGTALKPAREDWVLARKPLIGTVVENVLEHDVGAINIDGCRVPFAGAADEKESKEKNRHADLGTGPRTNQVYGTFSKDQDNYDAPGRWPTNLIHDGSVEVVAMFPYTTSGDLLPTHRLAASENLAMSGPNQARSPRTAFGGDSGSAARFFYCAKPSPGEKHAGLSVPNPHPTVKPITLMRHLIRLITPKRPDAVVLDFFCGSGTTGCAATLEGLNFFGVDEDPVYVEIAKQRIAHWEKQR